MSKTLFGQTSWLKFDYDPILAEWRQHALSPAIESISAAHNKQWFRHEETWFVGVNALLNDLQGRIAGSRELQGIAVQNLQHYVRSAFEFPNAKSACIEWDRAQISVCYPGYPKQSPEETDAAHLFRIRHDAAHVDGLLKGAGSKARYAREHHAFILGIPLSEYSADAAPFVVWEGSHKIIQQRLKERLETVPVQAWSGEDISQAYVQARKEVFRNCKRREIYAQVGESFAVHRLAVHGMARWGERASSDANGRMIAYFRPQIIDAYQWLNAK